MDLFGLVRSLTLICIGSSLHSDFSSMIDALIFPSTIEGMSTVMCTIALQITLTTVKGLL